MHFVFGDVIVVFFLTSAVTLLFGFIIMNVVAFLFGHLFTFCFRTFLAFQNNESENNSFKDFFEILFRIKITYLDLHPSIKVRKMNNLTIEPWNKD